MLYSNQFVEGDSQGVFIFNVLGLTAVTGAVALFSGEIPAASVQQIGQDTQE